LTEGVAEYMRGFGAAKGYASVEEAVHAYFKEHESTSLLQRFLEPHEVANACLFLGSQLGSGINGHAQRVDGGIIRHV
jgi:enoyl-[acyl-carrier-protein] reductase (NADH)